MFTAAGEIITAESSIGKIKRFNQDGDLIGVVGKAQINAGCKHVALGFDASGMIEFFLSVEFLDDMISVRFTDD